MQTKLFLIRHGITKWNQQKKYCGHKDVALSQEGKAQASKLAKRLKSFNFDSIYASDRKRALQTARIIFGKAMINKVKELKELNFGMLEGLKHEEILKKFPKSYPKWLKDPFKHTIPKGESLNVFQKRVIKAFNKLAISNRGKTIAIVCHGGTISVLITKLLKKKTFWGYVPDSASLSIVEYKNNKPKILLLNCTKHLRGKYG
jgi:broad specificity phosphatase PhoE